MKCSNQNLRSLLEQKIINIDITGETMKSKEHDDSSWLLMSLDFEKLGKLAMYTWCSYKVVSRRDEQTQEKFILNVDSTSCRLWVHRLLVSNMLFRCSHQPWWPGSTVFSVGTLLSTSRTPRDSQGTHGASTSAWGTTWLPLILSLSEQKQLSLSFKLSCDHCETIQSVIVGWHNNPNVCMCLCKHV